MSTIDRRGGCGCFGFRQRRHDRSIALLQVIVGNTLQVLLGHLEDLFLNRIDQAWIIVINRIITQVIGTTPRTVETLRPLATDLGAYFFYFPIHDSFGLGSLQFLINELLNLVEANSRPRHNRNPKQRWPATFVRSGGNTQGELSVLDEFLVKPRR